MRVFEQRPGAPGGRLEREGAANSAKSGNERCMSPCEARLREALGRAAAGDEESLRIELLFSGDVQGVGFRWVNQGLARERHLTGWVKNNVDGTVAMEVQGAPRALGAHLERLHAHYAHYARYGNRIWLEKTAILPLRAGEETFDVRY